MGLKVQDKDDMMIKTRKISLFHAFPRLFPRSPAVPNWRHVILVFGS